MPSVRVGEIVVCFCGIRKRRDERAEFRQRLVRMPHLIFGGAKRQPDLKVELLRRIRGQGLPQIVDLSRIFLLRLKDSSEAERRRR